VKSFLASLLQTSVSHDPTEIIIICQFDAQETFIIKKKISLFSFLKKT